MGVTSSLSVREKHTTRVPLTGTAALRLCCAVAATTGIDSECLVCHSPTDSGREAQRGEPGNRRAGEKTPPGGKKNNILYCGRNTETP